jgi:hypothetical protein
MSDKQELPAVSRERTASAPRRVPHRALSQLGPRLQMPLVSRTRATLPLPSPATSRAQHALRSAAVRRGERLGVFRYEAAP